MNSRYKILRKLGISILGISALIGQYSCSKFLDKLPYDIVTESYYKSPSDVQTGLIGIYDILGREQLFGGTYSSFLTLGDEGAYYRNTYTAGPEVYNYDASNANNLNMWRFLYEGIERANVFLEKVPDAEMDIAQKTVALGEAKFLRAFYYFILVTNWGDVPLKITSTTSVKNTDLPRSSQEEVYDFIVKEMIEADGMVSDISVYNHASRVTKSAVRGILARVYLKMAGQPLNKTENYAKALAWASKLVYPEGNQYVHKLIPDYTKIFKDIAADKYNIDESIFEVELYGNRLGDFEAGRIGNFGGVQDNNEAKGFSYGFIAATPKLYKLYETQDVRRDWNIANFYYSGTNSATGTVTNYTVSDPLERRHMAKYRREYEVKLPKNKNYTPINFPLLRYSDVLLMFAEAENEVNGPTGRAKEALNQVRSRAGASDLTTLITDKAVMQKYVREERMRELCYEGLRKFDMVRYGTFISEMKGVEADYNNSAANNYKYMALAFRNVSARDIYFPIPVNDISLNKLLTQSEGW